MIKRKEEETLFFFFLYVVRCDVRHSLSFFFCTFAPQGQHQGESAKIRCRCLVSANTQPWQHLVPSRAAERYRRGTDTAPTAAATQYCGRFVVSAAICGSITGYAAWSKEGTIAAESVVFTRAVVARIFAISARTCVLAGRLSCHNDEEKGAERSDVHGNLWCTKKKEIYVSFHTNVCFFP